jgi:septal ring factor EnvC (AmiA/AmiB activator)
MEATAGDRVEAPFLQLVLERLWRDTVADGAHVLTLARLEALGGARRIVENHLLEALGRLTPPEQDTASDCFRFLVSSSKTKIAHPAADLAEWTRRPEAQVTAVLDKLCSGASGRILRAVAPAADEVQSVSYELFHDVLAEPILAWRRGHELARSRRAAHRRLVRVASVALALIAVFAALGIWALIERGHANRLFHEQEAASRKLGARVVVLERTKTDKANAAAAQLANVKRLRKTNRSLKGETARLRSTRDGLDRQIKSLRARSRELTTGITRFNGQNRVLAAKINRLDRESDRLTLKLADLHEEQAALVDDAGILKVEVGALNTQLKALDDHRDELSEKAQELGYREHFAPSSAAKPVLQTPRRVPKKAVVFGIPAALAGSDALRRRVEALERDLARLLEQRARLTDEADWLTKDNTLLVQQRDALRTENEHLETTRAALDSRNRRLQRTLEAARAEHERLSSQAAARVIRNRRRRHTVDVRARANGALQVRINEHAETIGSTQGSISQDRGEIRTLVRFIAPRVDDLLKGAKDPSQDPALAGLLAVKAYQLTPFGPDDPAHPDVYNTLWLALGRLDAKAARDLIAPVASPRGKVGTTQSALIVQRICALVTRGFTQDEWSGFLPAGAPYDAKSSRPCA